MQKTLNWVTMAVLVIYAGAFHNQIKINDSLCRRIVALEMSLGIEVPDEEDYREYATKGDLVNAESDLLTKMSGFNRQYAEIHQKLIQWNAVQESRIEFLLREHYRDDPNVEWIGEGEPIGTPPGSPLEEQLEGVPIPPGGKAWIEQIELNREYTNRLVEHERRIDALEAKMDTAEDPAP